VNTDEDVSHLSDLPVRVFLSWSGETSHQVAVALREWLRDVLQFVRPYLSSSDTEKGSQWQRVISHNIAESHFGIICLTRSNLDSRWLNFEAGALAKELAAHARVSPFLFRLSQTELTGPLSQLFQTTSAEREDVRKLVHSINRSTTASIDEQAVDRSFERCWPELETRLAAIQDEVGSPALPQRTDRQVLEELLELVRTLSRDTTTNLPSPTTGTMPMSFATPMSVSGTKIIAIPYRGDAVKPDPSLEYVYQIPQQSTTPTFWVDTARTDPSPTPSIVDPEAWLNTGRNEPCPCGSGKKYKMCHGR
jgi:uncharacterized protein YecA (UPF0149 family)